MMCAAQLQVSLLLGLALVLGPGDGAAADGVEEDSIHGADSVEEDSIQGGGRAKEADPACSGGAGRGAGWLLP